MLDVTADDLRVDTVSTPLAILILGLVLRNLVLIIVPLIMIGTTILLWSTIMYPLVLHVLQVTQFTPRFMMSITIAMGIDYSLFLLTRARGVDDKEVAIAEALGMAESLAELHGFPGGFIVHDDVQLCQ